MKRYLLLFLGIMIAAITMANDVITKKNGTTIQCKVMKVGRTEVEYKNITNLDGPVYALDLTEIASITYENGAVDKFGEQSVVTTNAGQRIATDAELMRMYNQMNGFNSNTGKKWRVAGYVIGGFGIAMVALSAPLESITSDEYSDGIDDFVSWIVGGSCIAIGIGCYAIGRRQQKNAQLYNSYSLFEQDFQLSNKTMLSADVNMINNNLTHDKSLGLGLRFTF